ncbi:UDP-N-acetylmuramoyl-tripeptide--D-alanyl-D-alanine ligase [Candidatus Hepatincolaceae symbiont of Richtersius coronifer]
MKINQTLLAKITSGTAYGNFEIDSYSIDTRSLKENDMLIALIGENFDGHIFLADAIAKKCKALMVSQAYYNKNNIEFSNLLVVADPLKALTAIANYTREYFKGLMIGITGSIGKTTLKEMVSILLKDDFKVASSKGNFNNHIGLPLSLSHLENTHEVGIFEMGMSAPGEISFLTQILKPNIGVITTIAPAHLAFFEAIDDIATAKSEILEGMQPDGIIFLDQDNLYHPFLKEKAVQRKIKNIFSFSLKDNKADIYIKDFKIYFNDAQDHGAEVKAVIFQQPLIYNIKTIAQHNILLSALALGIVKCFIENYATSKFELESFAQKLINFTVPAGRGQIKPLKIKKQDKIINLTLIDDSYNANPVSMKTALDNFAAIGSQQKILILGDMLDLGDNSDIIHCSLKLHIQKVKPKKIFFLGKKMQAFSQFLRKEYYKDNDFFSTPIANKDLLLNDIKSKIPEIKSFLDHEMLLAELKLYLDDQDIVLIKGSNGSKVHKVSTALQQWQYAI